MGLLGALSGIDAQTLLKGNQIFQEFKGALTEQYVLQQLLTQKETVVSYWSADNGTAEMDFVIQHDGKIVPVEVKAEENLKAKSLRIYVDKYNPPLAVRASMSDFRKEEWLTNLPLYAINGVTGLLA